MIFQLFFIRLVEVKLLLYFVINKLYKYYSLLFFCYSKNRIKIEIGFYIEMIMAYHPLISLESIFNFLISCNLSQYII